MCVCFFFVSLCVYLSVRMLVRARMRMHVCACAIKQHSQDRFSTPEFVELADKNTSTIAPVSPEWGHHLVHWIGVCL